MKKITILVMVISFIAILYGCHSSGGHLASQFENKTITSREAVINDQGKLSAMITFPSGTKIEVLEENTLTPGIKVVATEEIQTSSTKYSGYFSDYSPESCYIYSITAFYSSSGGKTYVNSIEKPFRITLSKQQNKNGALFIAFKESDSDPWRFFNFTEDSKVLADMAGIRFAGVDTQEYSFDIFRLGSKFAILTLGGKENGKLPETIVTSLIASQTASIGIKGGRYCEDLRFKGVMEGKNLDSLKPIDLRARITYRNNSLNEAPIKVNDSILTQHNKTDKSIPGNAYYHSFVVDTISSYSLNNANGEYSFVLNLDGIDIQNFPTGFLIEFYNKIDSEKILPYYYAEFYRVETHEKKDEPAPEPHPQPEGTYTITYNLDGGKVAVPNPTYYDEASATFILNEPEKPGYTFIGWSGTGLTGKNNLTVAINQGSTGNKTYIANYTPINYNITYRLDDGVLVESNPEHYDITSETIILNNPTKDNFRFVGWTGSNGDTPQTTVIIEQGSTGNKTYIANYTSANYVITYNLDGGTVSPPNPNGYNTASATFTLKNPTKPGYTFIGWTGSNGDTPQTSVKIDQGSIEDKVYNANYNLLDYNIAYNLAGGSLEPSKNNPEKYDVTSATIILNNPTKEGYTFTGWTGSNGNTPQPVALIEKGSTGSRNFTANWSINSYMLTLNKGTGIDEVTGYGMHKYNSSVVASCTMIDGYEFEFWTGNDGIAVFNMPARDVEMQANARLKNFSITCNLNGGTTVAPNLTSYNLISDSITLINPTKDGYSFDGWTGSNGDMPQTDVTINSGSTGDKTYDANWSIVTYSIEYNLYGGSFTTGNPERYDVTTEDIVLSNPTKDGFRFVGWTGSNGDDPEFTVTIPQGSTGNKKYYANYIQTDNMITYNLNGGTNHPDNPYGFNIASETFTLYPASKLGCVFIGWTGSNGDVPEMSVTIVSGTIGDLNYTANFEAVPYTISYLLNGGTNDPFNPTGYSVETPTFALLEPSRQGFAFVGWTEDAATFPLILTKIPRGSIGNKTFTAHWIESVTFYLPGGVPLVMHKIPHGTFIMGSPDGELGREINDYAIRESPQHQVTLTQDFYMGKFEVTQEQYQAVMGTNPSNFSGYEDSPSRPVERVLWRNAYDFCASLTDYLSNSIPSGYKFSLPTEAQWEYACRAGTTSSLNNGTEITSSSGRCDNLSVVAWYSFLTGNKTYPVGQKQPNAWGLYDMHGNVWEWCLDSYEQNYYQTCGDCTDPTGPINDRSVVRRGGSGRNSPGDCRSAQRSGSITSVTDNFFGFRLSLVPIH
ncbi:MAG: InlB B-repeat-containing protein [Candidatus Riflebacteria bacterium]|nr:InlB B-repeat-containing protein [Candidatus Riflebacteria bacterium]